MQKKLLFVALIAITYLSIVHRSSAIVLAVSPSPVASPANLDEVTENLKKRLQDSLSPDEPTPLSLKRAYVGVVKDLIKDTLILEDKDGRKDIVLAEETVIVRSPGNTLIKAENIRIDDSIIAIGTPTDNDTLTGRRLIVSTEPIAAPAKSSGLGTLTSVTKTSLTLKSADLEQDLSLSSKTVFKSTTGLLEISDLTEGDTLVYTATRDAKDDLTATIIMRIGSSSL